MKLTIYRTGRPGDVAGSRIDGYRHGSGLRLYFSARDYEGEPLANPGAYDAILKFADSEDGNSFLEFHSLSADPVDLVDAADAQWLFDLKNSDLGKLEEGGDYHFEIVTFDGAEEAVQDKGRIRVFPKNDTTAPVAGDIATIRGGAATLNNDTLSIGAV